MYRPNNYCPVVEICPHKPKIVSNSYFLIQPFDGEKDKREEAIENALKEFHGKNNYKILKSDKNIYNRSIYCDICYKIKSSECCIADISGECHKIYNEQSGEIESKQFLRPNVALELGLAYGFNKPALILSRSLGGKRIIPSDIEFIRYIDIPVEVHDWTQAPHKILERLKASATIRPITELIDIDFKAVMKLFKKHYGKMLQLKKVSSQIKNKEFKINHIRYLRGDLIGIIKDAPDLIDGVYFKFYILDGEIEELMAILKVHHVQENGLVQVKFYPTDDNGADYLRYVFQNCREKNSFVPDEHRLDLIIPEDLNRITSEDIRYIIEIIDRAS